jgi:hypothetical protein
VVIFFACLFIPFFPAGDLEQISSFMDGHYVKRPKLYSLM